MIQMSKVIHVARTINPFNEKKKPVPKCKAGM